MAQPLVVQLEERAGEARVNAIRVIAVTLFYAQHATMYFLVTGNDATITAQFHQQVTLIAIFWGLCALAIFVGLQREAIPPWLKYAAVFSDVMGITCLLIAARSANNTFMPLYLIVIASTPLRLSLPLVYFATLASVGGYLSYLATYAWVQIGSQRYYSEPSLQIARSLQIMSVLTIIVAGLLAGQVVRQYRRGQRVHSQVAHL